MPKGTVPQALFWDTIDPYHYLRVDDRPRHDCVILGGEDHKTGQVDDTEERFRKLEKLLAAHLPNVDIDYRWSGQVIETNDGLPLIGETAEKQFVGTGYSGNGMTFGTLGAIMACDAALGRKSPWQALFDVNRKKASGWDMGLYQGKPRVYLGLPLPRFEIQGDGRGRRRSSRDASGESRTREERLTFKEN